MQVNDPTFEPALSRQLQPNAHVGGQRRLSATDDDRHEKQVTFVDEARGHYLAPKMSSAHADITGQRILQVVHGCRIDIALNRRSLTHRLGERPRIHDLVGAAPDVREIPGGSMLTVCGYGLPVHHRLVHPASVEIRADRSLELVDECVHFVVGRHRCEVAVLVFHVSVERRDRRVDQLGHLDLLGQGFSSSVENEVVRTVETAIALGCHRARHIPCRRAPEWVPR